MDAADTARIPCNVRRFQNDQFTFWRCDGCGSLHCVEDVDLAAYYAHYPIKQQKLDFHERIGYRNRLRMLERAGLRRDDRILDYGCGPGLFVEFLRQHGYRHARGYDPYEAAFSDSAARAEVYDAVLSYDVIEHDDDPRGFLISQTRLLKPGGLLLVGTPNADGISLARPHNPALHPPYHRHILSERALLSLARESGLTPTRVVLRSYFDSLVPTVNSRFMWRYLEKKKVLDASVEAPDTALVLRSPDLLFLAFAGYFLPRRDNMMLAFKKVAAPAQHAGQCRIEPAERKQPVAAV
jgi:SAM-dependent methyltransferase